MKKLITLFAFVLSLQAFSLEIESSQTTLNPGRVVEIVKLVDKSDIKVNVVVHDLGGSTDVSPTQELFFTLYTKGEMFSTDAVFNLGKIYELLSAKRVSGGVYEIKVIVPNEETTMPEEKTFLINAVEAILNIKAVDCNGDFDCDASANFKAKIELSTK